MKPALPPSETRQWLNVTSTLLALGVLVAMMAYDLVPDIFLRVLIVLAVAALPIFIDDLFIRKLYRIAPAMLATVHRSGSLKRIACKILGLTAVFAVFYLCYVIFPVYREGLYDPYWRFLPNLVLFLYAASPFYFWFCDRRLSDPEDGYYHLGRLLLRPFNRSKPIAWGSIGRLYRNWLVKAFFLPLMFVYTFGNIASISNTDLHKIVSFDALYDLLNNSLYLIDLFYATVGYIFTLRILNAHIRSSDPTMLGWVSALACYDPFWSGVMSGSYLSYNTGAGFITWFGNNPVLLALWGGAILLLVLIYAWATVCMGLRFSNVTYRGLITSGPYAWCKHPAYVTKNLSWWLISMPFIDTAGTVSAISHCLLLFGLNTIYFIRARTEERHLSNYPEYVAYAEAMNERSLLRPITKLIPALRYTKPINLPRI